MESDGCLVVPAVFKTVVGSLTESRSVRFAPSPPARPGREIRKAEYRNSKQFPTIAFAGGAKIRYSTFSPCWRWLRRVAGRRFRRRLYRGCFGVCARRPATRLGSGDRLEQGCRRVAREWHATPGRG